MRVEDETEKSVRHLMGLAMRVFVCFLAGEVCVRGLWCVALYIVIVALLPADVFAAAWLAG